MRAIHRVQLVATVLFAAAPSAGAQVRPDSTDSARVTLQAVTVTETRAAAMVGGAAAVVIRTDQLRTSPAPLLDQALRETPFVHVRQNSRGEMELSVRGSDSRQAAVMMDGVPMSLGWDHRTDPSLIPMTGSQSLVVVRGLGTLLNGPNTLGGSIEVSHRPGASREAWAGGGFDQTGALVTTLGAGREVTSVMGGALTLRGGVTHRQRDGSPLADGATDPTAADGLRTNSDLRQTDAFAGMNWRGAMGRTLALNVSGFDSERGVPPEEHITAPRLWRYPYHTRAVASASGNTGTFGTPFGFGNLELGAGYNTGRVKILSYTDRTYGTTDGEELGDERSFVARAKLTHSLGNATFRSAVTASDIHYDETLTGVLSEYRQLLWSAGAEIEMPVGTSGTIGGGVVYDRSSSPETGGRTPGQVPVDAIGWRAGAAREFSSGLRWHASASQRARFPALRELYSGALNRFQPNPSLKPETLLGFETGVTMDRDVGDRSSLAAEATVFHHNLEDGVVRITEPNPTPPPATLFRRINRDNILSSGLELMAGLTLGPVRERAVTITGDALLQSITIRDQTLAGQPERHSENNPEMRGSLELGAPMPLRVRATANARYTGTQYCINADTGNEMMLASQVESDVSLERTFARSLGYFRTLRALISVDNVANATVFDQCGLPQPGRTLRLMFVMR